MSEKIPSWFIPPGDWLKMDGANKYYANWPLTSESIVLDIGAYQGYTTYLIASQYGCKVYAFEPSPNSFKLAQERTRGCKNVTLLPYGLGVRNGVSPLGDSDRDGASFLRPTIEPVVQAEIREIGKALSALGLSDIDLAIMNIEGAEFELVSYIIASDLILYFKRFMIQWHPDGPKDIEKKLEIQTQLAQTHYMLWNLGAFEAWQIQEM